MIRSWADLQAFLDNGGRMVFRPGDPGAPSSWRDAATGRDIAPTLATRALADGEVELKETLDGESVYGRSAA